MKRLITSLPAGLMPVYKSDLVTIQDNLYSALLAICKAYDPGYSFILQGMIPSIVGADIVVTAGYWWRQSTNEIIYFPGGTIVASTTAYVSKGATTSSTKVYKDGSTQTVYEETTSVITTGSTTPGDIIQYASGVTVQDLYSVIKAVVNTNGTPVNVTYQNSWSDNSQPVKYSKNTNGTVSLRGNAQHTGASSATIFTLPAGYRPAQNMTIITHNGSAACLISIETNGAVIPTSQTVVFFDGITFNTN